MPLLKRKPVLMHPLPSLRAVLQPLHEKQSHAAATSTSAPPDSSPAPDGSSSSGTHDFPTDAKDDEEQTEKLLNALHTTVTAGPPAKRTKTNGGAGAAAPNGTTANGGGSSSTLSATTLVGFRVKDPEVFFIPETGEIFLDYESFSARRAFLDQPLYQCEVSGKSALSYFEALESEAEEVRRLHARFPRQLKKAVLQSVQFQIEGKLDTLADKIFERFQNRFFNDEKVFVDVQGDKYLARVVRTFLPKNLVPLPGAEMPFHPYAVDLNESLEDVNMRDDPMKYFYQVRLIEPGGEGIAAEYSSANGMDDDGVGEKFQGSVMEVQADKISRDRINFSRAMLKRFIRDCVHRDAAICSPWLVKPAVAKRYNIPTEIPDEIQASIVAAKKGQMDKRKRDREERLGITHSDVEEKKEAETDGKPKKKRRTAAEREQEKEDRETQKQREKEEKEAQKQKEKEEKERAKELEEEERKKRKALKYPCEDLLVEYLPDRDGQAGRIEVRPIPSKQLPFGEEFETFLMTWSFLNVMGKPLGLSPFTVDDYEQALYHSDPYSSTVPLIAEIHAVLLNALIKDVTDGHDPVHPIAHTGGAPENDTDYWEGRKGATTETLRPVVAPMVKSWKDKTLSVRDNRKHWEQALVGCLWERASLDSLPSYLDNILFLTFEDKPAPTRPTWSTGPKSNAGPGLVHSQPAKRYSQLHFRHKLHIISFLIELVSQTQLIRDFMDEATAELTEVRKEQVEVKREWRKLQQERNALEPKKEKDDGDDDVKHELTESRAASPNGHLHRTVANTEHDELESSMGEDRGVVSRAASRGSSPLSDTGRAYTGAQRRKAMKEKAAEREAEETMRLAQIAKEREEVRARRAEEKIVSAEKKRIQDEQGGLEARLRQLDYDFRRYHYTLRARPLGTDRFGNKIWLMDGLGSAPFHGDPTVGGSNKTVPWGTGRLYIQGADPDDVTLCRQGSELTEAQVAARREREEGGAEGRLAPGEWGVYDTPEQIESFVKWLNPRGTREVHLHRALSAWWDELEGGMHRRRLAMGLEVPPDDEGAVRRTRPARRAAGDEPTEGYLSWRNKRVARE